MCLEWTFVAALRVMLRLTPWLLGNASWSVRFQANGQAGDIWGGRVNASASALETTATCSTYREGLSRSAALKAVVGEVQLRLIGKTGQMIVSSS